MKSNERKAKVTAESREESALLFALWQAKTDKPSQAEFGESFEIGTQGAVSQFLQGKAPLSMKAAKGFATGLGCPISAFSKRLAEEAQAVSAVNGPALNRASDVNWPFSTVTPDQYFEVLSQAQRDIVEAMANTLVNSRDAPEKHQSPAKMSAISSKPAKAA
jgi:hypothetical protein